MYDVSIIKILLTTIKIMFNNLFKTLDETKLDDTYININTHLPVYITMSTIPSRMKNTFKIVEHFLKYVSGFEKLIINIPKKYNRWPLMPVTVNNSINDGRLVINRCEDYGPLTKFLPSIPMIPPNSITIVCDDMCYKLNSFKDIAEIQDQDRRKSFSFYVYPYGDKPVMVPQGADLISMYSGNAKKFPEWYKMFLDKMKLKSYYDSPCFFVDDQVIGWYFQYQYIPMVQVERKHRNIYIKDCDKTSDVNNLNMQKGKNSRDNTMNGCYSQLSKTFPL